MGGRGSAGGKGALAAPSVGDKIMVADWFRVKIDKPSYSMTPHGGVIVGESASGKAFKVTFDTETLDGERDISFTRYVPKSVVKTVAQYKRDRAIERDRADKAYETGQQKYEKLLNFAKGKVNVRNKMRKDTIIAKLKEAGYDYKW